jgi:hypothetical protein
MGIFDFESAQTKVRNRIGAVKALADQLNAEYYDGISQIKNKFGIDDSDSDIKNSNAIVGELQGFEYCFVEYYHRQHGKNDSSKWVTNVYLRLNKDDFPDFQLMTKTSALTGAGCILIFGLPFFCVPLFLIFQAITMFTTIFKNTYGLGLNVSIIFPLITMTLISLVFGAVGWFIISASIKTIKSVYGQGKYNILNYKFREKYVIISEADVNSIRKVFTENVVSGIVNHKPEITNINCHNCCFSSSFNHNEQLTYALCNKYLGPLLKQAQIFEEPESF